MMKVLLFDESMSGDEVLKLVREDYFKIYGKRLPESEDSSNGDTDIKKKR